MTVREAPRSTKGARPLSRRQIPGQKTGAPSSPGYRQGHWVGPGPKGAPSPGPTAAARRFSGQERPPLTCDWREHKSLLGVGPTHSDTELQTAMAAAALVRASSFRAGGCFSPEGSQDSSAARLQFRLLAVPRPVLPLNAPRAGACSPHTLEGAAGAMGIGREA